MTKDSKRDKEIVELIKQNRDNEGIVLLFETRGKELKGIIKYVMNNNGSQTDGEIIHDESVTDFWYNCKTDKFIYNPKYTLIDYIFGIARNKWHKELKIRKRGFCNFLENDEEVNFESSEDKSIFEPGLEAILFSLKYDRDEYLALSECWQELSEKQQKIIWLKDVDELSLLEVALILEYAKLEDDADKLVNSSHVVKVTYYNIRKILKNCLDRKSIKE